MARYIDADKVMEEIKRIGGHNLCEWDTLGVKALIDRTPTADVVPKSEVEELKNEIDRLKYNLKAVIEEIPETKAEVATEIFAEIDSIFRKQYEICSKTDLKLLEPILQGERFIINEMWHDVAELKKEYIPQAADKPPQYFTPEDVRRMTAKDVKDNYTAIMESMKKW